MFIHRCLISSCQSDHFVIEGGGLRNLMWMVLGTKLSAVSLGCAESEGEKNHPNILISSSVWSLDPGIIRDQAVSHSAPADGPGVTAGRHQ